MSRHGVGQGSDTLTKNTIEYPQTGKENENVPKQNGHETRGNNPSKDFLWSTFRLDGEIIPPKRTE